MLGRLLPEGDPTGPVPRRGLLPGRRFELPARRLRGGTGQLQRYAAVSTREYDDRLRAAGTFVQALLLRGPVQSGSLLHLPAAEGCRYAGSVVRREGEGRPGPRRD